MTPQERSFGSAVNPVTSAEIQDNAFGVPMVKPIRLFQFLIAAILLVTTVWLVLEKPTQFDIVVTILLTLLFGSFFLVALIDIISQFIGDPIPDTPMFLFGVVATPSFLTAAGGILVAWIKTSTWELLLIACLSGTCAVFHLLDVLLIFSYGY